MNARTRQLRFERLVASFSDDLFRFACWLTHDRSVAEDLVQETMIRAWRSIDKLRDDNAVKPWLLTTLRRENARRFERKQLPLVDIDDHAVADEGSGGSDDALMGDQLRQALARLPEKYREPLSLQVIMGCSIAEIAEALELSRSAVMTRVFRAREKLREQLSADIERIGQVA